MAKSQISTESTPRHDSFGGCLVNLFWLIACPGTLGLTAMGIAVSGRRGLGWLDALFWIVVLLAPAGRYLEARLSRHPSAGSEPEAVGAWRPYALKLAAIAAVVWIAAHGVACLSGR